MPARILIADDDAAFVELLRTVLAPHAAITVARDGIEAIAAFRSALETGQHFAAVCLDQLMPGMDGNRTLRALRRTEATHAGQGWTRARIVVVSALRDRAQVLRALESGCDSYLVKPLEPQSVVVRLRELGVFDERAA